MESGPGGDGWPRMGSQSRCQTASNRGTGWVYSSYWMTSAVVCPYPVKQVGSVALTVLSAFWHGRQVGIVGYDDTIIQLS